MTDSAREMMEREEEEFEDMRQREEDEKKKKSYESPYKDYYKDKGGNLYDPNKKFGII